MTLSAPESMFDVAVIGGGIAGAGIARDAALRGLSVILFEKNKVGSGTSSRSSKLIHGGIRYLDLAWQALLKGRLGAFWKNFRFVSVSLRECRILERIAPHLVRPICLVIPIYRSAGRSPWPIYFGAVVYSLLSLLAGNFHLPRILPSRRAVLKWLPDLAPKGLIGGVAIWDHTADDLELVRAVIASAVKNGAKVHEHAEVKGYRFDPVRDLYELRVLTEGAVRLFLARKLVNASGPWVDRVRAAGGEKGEPLIVPVAGAHVMLKRFVKHSVILQANDKRLFFVINRGDFSRVGTTERIHENPDHVEPTLEEEDYLMEALRRYFPARSFRREDILGRDAGIRPLARPKEALSPHDISREHEIRIGPTGVIHVIGVKLTDHRRAAKQVVDHLSFKKTRTHRVPLA